MSGHVTIEDFLAHLSSKWEDIPLSIRDAIAAPFPAWDLLSVADRLSHLNSYTLGYRKDYEVIWNIEADIREAEQLKKSKQNSEVSMGARRYQMCIDAGLKMPKDDYGRMPNGVGKLANKDGVSRAAFTESIWAYIRQM